MKSLHDYRGEYRAARKRAHRFVWRKNQNDWTDAEFAEYQRLSGIRDAKRQAFLKAKGEEHWTISKVDQETKTITFSYWGPERLGKDVAIDAT